MSDFNDFLKVIASGKQDAINRSPGLRALKQIEESIHKNNPFSVKSKPPTILVEDAIFDQPEQVDNVVSPVSNQEHNLVERSLGVLGGDSSTKTQDPLTPLDQKFATLDDLQKHYKLFLERIQQQLSTLGGGGETNLAFMDMPIKYVTSSSYTVTPRDYYIGVNYAGAVTIVLPTPKKNGKTFIVKDELGEASKGTNRYITVLPSNGDLIDGQDRAILAFDFGSLTFVYRNGWRVV